jgi:hypothetical protein
MGRLSRMWERQTPGNSTVCPGLYRDCFILPLLYFSITFLTLWQNIRMCHTRDKLIIYIYTDTRSLTELLKLKKFYHLGLSLQGCQCQDSDSHISQIRQDFQLFWALRDSDSNTKSETDDVVICAVRTWLRVQDRSWYRQGVHTLVPQWRKSVVMNGDLQRYMEWKLPNL